MNDAGKSDGGSSGPRADEGVLAKLPPTRPQRSSRRRTAARTATVGAARGGATEASTEAETAATGADSPASRAPAGTRTGTGATASARKRKPQKDVPRDRARGRRVGPRLQPAASKRDDSSRREQGVPRQGFDSESDLATGPVQPPGGVELVASAAEIVAELARAGLSAGERVLADLVARLPRP
jgi:hypothetical protein